MKNLLKLIFLSSLLLTQACTYESMGSSEHGVVFEKLPPIHVGSVGIGGLKKRILRPKEVELLFFWEDLYRFDTSIHSISWGGQSPEYPWIQTRTRDGNEVGLAVTIRYHLEPEKLPFILQNVGSSDERVRKVVSEVARSDIRTHMNSLHTQDFFNTAARTKAISNAQMALNKRLNSEGIVVDAVFYNDHRFEKQYQDLIEETQAVVQKTEREEKRILTLVEDRKRRLQEAHADVNRAVEQAIGYRTQAELKGNGYLKSRRNEAKRITALGKAEVDALKEKIKAYSGPGGEALLKIELVKEMLKSNPKFVLVEGSKQGSDMQFQKIDTNLLLQQLGLLNEMSSPSAPAKKQ